MFSRANVRNHPRLGEMPPWGLKCLTGKGNIRSPYANLAAPPGHGLEVPGNGQALVLEDEVALRFFRLQQMTEGSIALSDGEAFALKGPTDVGTGYVKESGVTLSSLIDRLNERFGTDFTEADQLFFDQIQASAENDRNIAEAARANTFRDFDAYLDRVLDELFIGRMEGNEEIFKRVMTDTTFGSAAREHLASEIFQRVREKEAAE